MVIKDDERTLEWNYETSLVHCCLYNSRHLPFDTTFTAYYQFPILLLLLLFLICLLNSFSLVCNIIIFIFNKLKKERYKLKKLTVFPLFLLVLPYLYIIFIYYLMFAFWFSSFNAITLLLFGSLG